MGKRLAAVGLVALLCHCAKSYSGDVPAGDVAAPDAATNADGGGPKATESAGALDPTFGTKGLLALDAKSTSAVDLAVRPDGSYAVLVSYGGGAGLLTVPVAGAPSDVVSLGLTRPDAFAIAPDGKYLVGGVDPGAQLVLRRYSADGPVDPGFAKVQLGTTEAGTFGVRSIVVRADARIVVGYESNQAPYINGYAASGLPDPSWGDAGVAALLGQGAIILSAVPLGDGVAFSALSSNGTTFRVVQLDGSGNRVNDDQGVSVPMGDGGARDLFGAGNGSSAFFPGYRTLSPAAFQLYAVHPPASIAHVPVDAPSLARATVVQDDGKVVLAFTSAGGIELRRYVPDTGALDPTFGTAGSVIVPVGNALAARLVLDPAGHAVVAATVTDTHGVTSIVLFRVGI